MMYAALYPQKNGRPMRGFCRTIVSAVSEAALGVKIAVEVTQMMTSYRDHGVDYDVIVIEPTKKPTKNDLRMCNVPA